jgi:hypothetical protein
MDKEGEFNKISKEDLGNALNPDINPKLMERYGGGLSEKKAVNIEQLTITELGVEVKTSRTEEVWVEDEFHSNGDGGYYIDVEKTLEAPTLMSSMKLETKTHLEFRGHYLIVGEGFVCVSSSESGSKLVSNSPDVDINKLPKIVAAKEAILYSRGYNYLSALGLGNTL